MAAMFGGIALRGKLLVTLSGGLEGEVRVYDLGARRLVRQIPVPPRVAGRVEAGGVAIDADSSFWVADGAACQLRRFNPFGGELEPIGLEPTRSKPRDRRGLPAQARGVALDAHERLWVSGGDRPRVHGLQVFEREGRFVQSIAAFGRREGLYGPAYAVRILEDRVWLADTGNHCLLDLARPRGSSQDPGPQPAVLALTRRRRSAPKGLRPFFWGPSDADG
jgi:streptogramin lyase